jgi:DDE superfamily endonuclease
MIILRLPKFVQGYFRAMRAQLSRPQFRHLWNLVLALVLNLHAAKLLHLTALTPQAGHRTRRGAFLASSDWDAPALVQQCSLGLLQAMKPRKGEVVYLILDDTRLKKRGKQMAWVSKIYDHKTQRFIHGHMVLTAAVAFRGVVLPWRIDLWKPKGHSGGRYRKLTAMAAEMIRAFAAPKGLRVRVLFDAFYLCPAVTRACSDQGFTFFSVAQKGRSFTTSNGRCRKLKDLAPGLLRHHGRAVRMNRSRGTARLRLAGVDGVLSRIGPVRAVASKRPGDSWKKLVVIVTNERGLRPRQIVQIYERRWSIEVLFKELVQDLGLSDYQMLHKDAILRHLHLVCLAHLLLTHHSLKRLGAQATKPNKPVRLPLFRHRLHDLRQQILRDQVQHIFRGKRYEQVRQKIYDYMPMAA